MLRIMMGVVVLVWCLMATLPAAAMYIVLCVDFEDPALGVCITAHGRGCFQATDTPGCDTLADQFREITGEEPPWLIRCSCDVSVTGLQALGFPFGSDRCETGRGYTSVEDAAACKVFASGPPAEAQNRCGHKGACRPAPLVLDLSKEEREKCRVDLETSAMALGITCVLNR
jgi:hypothetical protein